MMKMTKSLKNKVIPFHFVPFSKQQVKVLTWWTDTSPYKDSDAIICDGAVRSGKTVSLCLSYVMWAMEKFNGYNFAICGKTVGATRRNVIQPLKQQLKSRHYMVEDSLSNGLIIIRKKYVDTKTGKVKDSINYFYVFGGKDEASQDLIQGITLAGVFFDEVALMPQSFVNQATARCSVKGAKFWFSCNPDNPFHWFKEEWIDKADEKKYLYLHFTMKDNPSLSPEVIERYESLYTGVFYKRYILGLWVLADGVVYPMFDSEKHMIDYRRNWTRLFIAGDFGIQNPTTFGLYGFYEPEKHYHLIDYTYHDGRHTQQKTTREYVDDLIELIERNNCKPEYIAIDPSAAALIVEIRKNSYFRRRGIKIMKAKNNVMLGIQTLSTLLNLNKFTIAPHCTEDAKEFVTYSWDSDKADKGEDAVIKTNDHCMDRNRYAVMTDSVLHKTLKNLVGFEELYRSAI